MSLFGKSKTNVAVIDIRSSSLGAAFVVHHEGASPAVIASVRIPLDPHATEPMVEALPRTFERVLTQLVSEGAPALRKASGSGYIDRVFVTVAAPWQQSTVFSRVIEHDRPFLFTRQSLNEKDVKAAHVIPEGMSSVSEMIIATLLNGYEVTNPFNKRIKRAELIMLSSAIDDSLMQMVRKQVHNSLHQRHIEFNAFMPEAYAVMRDLYPHQRDFLVMDIGNEATDILLVKHGVLVSMSYLPHGVGEIARAARDLGLSSPAVHEVADGGEAVLNTNRNAGFSAAVRQAETAWIAQMKEALGELAKQEPLPRTVFLHTEDSVRDFLRNLLDAPELRSLWLSDEALTLLPLLPAQFTPFLDGVNASGVDPALALIALASVRRLG